MTKVKISVRSSFFIGICCVCRYRFITPLLTDLYKGKNPRACVYRNKGNCSFVVTFLQLQENCTFLVTVFLQL